MPDPYSRDELPGVIAEWKRIHTLYEECFDQEDNPLLPIREIAHRGDVVDAFWYRNGNRLLATVEALAADVERYDHVRENAIAVLTEDDRLVIRIDIPADPKEIDRVNSRDACDMTIDAARKGTP